MNKKRIGLSAIIAVLPFVANAAQTIVTTNTPALVGSDGTINRAATGGPYQTAVIGEHDDEHIATTAYVKGAYNDTIAAMNTAFDVINNLSGNIAGITDDIDNKRVDIYTTWDTNDTTQVELSDLRPTQGNN